MPLSARHQRLLNSDIPLPPLNTPPLEKPKDESPIDPQLGEYGACFMAVLQGFTHKGRIINLRAMIVVPRALHPVFREEARLQIRSFLDNFLRTGQIAVNDFLDNNATPSVPPDNPVTLDMKVKLPSAESPLAPNSAAPQITITSQAAFADGQFPSSMGTGPAFAEDSAASC
jgi:hypothetical protein